MRSLLFPGFGDEQWLEHNYRFVSRRTLAVRLTRADACRGAELSPLRYMTSRAVFRALAAVAASTLALSYGRSEVLPTSARAAPRRIEARTDSLGPRIGTTVPTRIAFRNVDFHLEEGVLLRIRFLDGSMHSLKQGVVDLDDKASYVTDVDTGEVALTGADLTKLMNRHVFGYPEAPIKHLRLEMRGNEIRQRGTLHKGVDIPFDINAVASVTDDGRIRLSPTRIKIFGVDGKALMRALGINLEKMIDVSRARGIAVRGNDLLLEPLDILPPPAITGRIVSVHVAGEKLVQVFGRPGRTAHLDSETAAMAPPVVTARNYMYYRGGSLHFGKLFMTDAEMLVVDLDPADPFDFDNDNYQKQLVAGSSRTLPSLGLAVYMPDASKLRTVATVKPSR